MLIRDTAGDERGGSWARARRERRCAPRSRRSSCTSRGNLLGTDARCATARAHTSERRASRRDGTRVFSVGSLRFEAGKSNLAKSSSAKSLTLVCWLVGRASQHILPRRIETQSDWWKVHQGKRSPASFPHQIARAFRWEIAGETLTDTREHVTINFDGASQFVFHLVITRRCGGAVSAPPRRHRLTHIG